MSKNFLKKVDDNARYLWHELIKLQKKYNEIIEIRGAGFLLGIKTNGSNMEINKLFTKNRLLTICASDNVIRLAPPLIVTKKNIDEAIKKIERSFQTFND